jgi:uncharacterized membrane protein YqhA
MPLKRFTVNHPVFYFQTATVYTMDSPPHNEKLKTVDEQSTFERLFESGLWNSRLIVLLAVIFGTLSAIVLFVVGSIEILVSLAHAVSLSSLEGDWQISVLSAIIGGVDLYLIGMVLLIFSFGIYELAISKIDIARSSESFHTLLEISSLDDLKNKIIKVIIMVLIVSFFQRILVLSLKFTSPVDMLFMAASIAAICIGVYFLQRLKL